MPPPKARMRVSQACTVCSAKKIKCDGRLPQCGICVINERSCSYVSSKRGMRQSRMIRPLSQSPSTTSSPRVEEKSAQSTIQRPQTQDLFDSMPRVKVETLFRIYFTCIHHIWPLLYKPMYDNISHYDLLGMIPRPLVLAIFAIASCIQTEKPVLDQEQRNEGVDSATGPAEKAGMFYHAALRELQTSERNGSNFSMATALQPSITHCQTLTILALQQHGVAEFPSAGVLCSLAAAMAVDLRLHRNIWTDDAVQQEVASRLWWNIFVLDKMLASEMGKPIVLRFEDSDAPYPSASESDEYELLAPSHEQNLFGQEGLPIIKLRTISAFHTTIDMTKELELVIRDVYSLASREKIRKDRSYGDETRMRLSDRLGQWEKKLDASPLRLDLYNGSVAPPAMVTNYVAIKSAMILLHRPFVEHWEQYKTATGQGPFNTADPSDVCFRSSQDICLFLETYSNYLPRLPSDLIFIIFMVTETLFRRAQQSPSGETELANIQQRLKQCLKWLGVFGKNWKNASARQQLLEEKYNWTTIFNSKHGSPNAEAVDPLSMNTQLSCSDSAGSLSLDERQLADIFIEIKDWGFLQNLDDWLDTYNV